MQVVYGKLAIVDEYLVRHWSVNTGTVRVLLC